MCISSDAEPSLSEEQYELLFMAIDEEEAWKMMMRRQRRSLPTARRYKKTSRQTVKDSRMESLYERLARRNIGAVASYQNVSNSLHPPQWTSSTSARCVPEVLIPPDNHDNGYKFDPHNGLFPPYPEQMDEGFEHFEPVNGDVIGELPLTGNEAGHPLTTGPALKKAMKVDPIINITVKTLNKRLKTFLNTGGFGTSVHVNVDIKADVEDESWKKIIYKFHIDDDSSADKMDVWDNLIDYVDSNLEKIKDEHARSHHERDEFDEICRSVYVFINI